MTVPRQPYGGCAADQTANSGGAGRCCNRPLTGRPGVLRGWGAAQARHQAGLPACVLPAERSGGLQQPPLWRSPTAAIVCRLAREMGDERRRRPSFPSAPSLLCA